MIRHTAALALLLVSHIGQAQAQGQSDQLYFIAQAAPLGSLSHAGGGGAPAIYLRWDTLETALPRDLARFRLERGGEVLLDVAATAQMSPAEIRALYDGPGQARRKAEILRWLAEEAAAPGGNQSADFVLPDGVDTTNYAELIATRLSVDPAWRHFASRVDVNIARARYRAFLDTGFDLASGPLEYELIGVSDQGIERRLGRLSIDPAAPRAVPAAAGFRQILEARCDAPEQALDHGSVSLHWTHGGISPLTRFAASLAVAGYDLWRSVDNLAGEEVPVPPRDLAAEAAAAGFDVGGRLALEGLEKVNDQLVLISGGSPDFVQHKETLPELAARGLHPGDVRAYYLVPRDFSGHYGPTVGLRVTVPDLLAPPAPWNVELRQHSGRRDLSLSWDAVNVPNWLDVYGTRRKICNADRARATGRLHFVTGAASCGSEAPMAVNLDPAGYLVYRFGRFDEAARFTDSDGDGFSDLEERSGADSGSACRFDVGGDERRNFLLSPRRLPAPTPVVRRNGRQELRFIDTEPAAHPGRVYWYRIAAYGGLDDAGHPVQVGRLSPPLRAKFDERELPTRAALDERVTLSVPRRECRIHEAVFEAHGAEEPAVRVGRDHSGDARDLVLQCLSQGLGTPPPLRLSLVAGEPPVLDLSPRDCAALTRRCAAPSLQTGAQESFDLFAGFLGKDGAALGNPVRLDGFDFGQCAGTAAASLRVRLDSSGHCAEPTRAPLPGEYLPQPPVIDLNLAVGECVSVYRQLGGRDYRIRTYCGPEESGEHVLGLADMGLGETICLETVLHDQNNNVSARRPEPCFALGESLATKPPAPQPLALAFSGQDVEVSWRLPGVRVSATVIELFRGSDTSRAPVAVRLVGDSDGGLDALAEGGVAGRKVERRPDDLGAGALPRTQIIAGVLPTASQDEDWCVRLRAVGVGNWEDPAQTLSLPSALRCATRQPDGGPLPEYLAWPTTPLPPTGDTLAVGLMAAEELSLPVIELSELIPPLPTPAHCVDGYLGPAPSGSGPRAPGGGDPGGLSAEAVAAGCESSGAGHCQVEAARLCTVNQFAASSDICRPFRDALAGRLGFVVYRQSRQAGSESPGDFYQVSPLVDRLYCDVAQLETGGEARFGSAVADPFVKLAVKASGEQTGFQLVFADTYPRVASRDYRYELVYFDHFGEIRETRRSAWLEQR